MKYNGLLVMCIYKERRLGKRWPRHGSRERDGARAAPSWLEEIVLMAVRGNQSAMKVKYSELVIHFSKNK